jgi:hypothetical protein
MWVPVPKFPIIRLLPGSEALRFAHLRSKSQFSSNILGEEVGAARMRPKILIVCGFLIVVVPGLVALPRIFLRERHCFDTKSGDPLGTLCRAQCRVATQDHAVSYNSPARSPVLRLGGTGLFTLSQTSRGHLVTFASLPTANGSCRVCFQDHLGFVSRSQILIEREDCTIGSHG